MNPAAPSTPDAAAKVVVLPDAMFFTRAVPISAGATPDEAAAQVGLALEAISPFPPAQLYHGFFWLPGATRALVFAVYRRRFPREQVATWAEAALVLPAFAALVHDPVPPATTLLVNSPEGITALHWDDGRVPATVMFRAVTNEADPAERARLRDELVRAAGGSSKVIELASPPVAEGAADDDEFVFRAGDRVATLPAAVASSLDVRDKDDLAALRRARARDVALWRLFLGCAAAMLFVGLGSAALYAGSFWQKTRNTKVAAQLPVVEQIMTAQSLSTRINELSTKRLLPLEMISMVSGLKPASIQFTRTQTRGLYTLEVEALTTAPAEVSTFRSALNDLPSTDHVEVKDQRTRDNLMTFAIVITFKPDAVKPAS